MDLDDLDDTILNALNDSSYLGYFLYEKDGTIIHSNKYANEILGYKDGELKGKRIAELLIDLDEETRHIVENMLLEDEFLMENLNYIFRSKKGFLIPVSVSTYAISYKGNRTGFAVLLDKTKENSYEKLFAATSQISELIVRVEDEETLLRKICDIFVNTVGYEAATVGYIDDSLLFKQKYTKARTKEHESELKSLIMGVDQNTPYGKGSVAQAYESHRINLVSHVLKDSMMSYWYDYYRLFNINSACSIPIIKNGKVSYIFFLLDSMQNSFSENKIDDIIELADSCALEISAIIKESVAKGDISGEEIWDRNYIPVEGTNPQKYISKFTEFTRKYVQPVEDKYLRMNANFRYFVLTDDNGYIPVHNSISDKPLSGRYKTDLFENRSMRIFDDYVGISAARSADKYLVQTYSRDTGEIMTDVSVPIFFEGKHWGAIRVGAREDRMDLLEEIQFDIAFALEKIEAQLNMLLLQEKLKIAAFYDALTGLPNRRALTDELEKALARAARQKWQLAVAMIDLDNFKPVNDNFGHEAGDIVLQVVGKRLRNSIRSTDFISRIGGDEFVLILEDCGDMQDLTAVLKKIEENIKGPIGVSEGNTVSVGLSMGVYLNRLDVSTTSDVLLRYADSALYQSKEHKENREQYWTIR